MQAIIIKTLKTTHKHMNECIAMLPRPRGIIKYQYSQVRVFSNQIFT